LNQQPKESEDAMPKPKKQPKTVRIEPVEKPVAVYPTHSEIARRAYAIYQARGGAPGGELDDWLQAERELNAAISGAASAGEGNV
jgi:hypothetical protein